MQITLANLVEATPQQVFDQVAKHLLTQNERSIDDYGGCMYRNGDLKCAAGCLIADNEYTPEMDQMAFGTAWDDLIKHNLAPSEHNKLIMRLQHIHDNFDPHDWPDKLGQCASDFNLTVQA